MRDGTRLGIMAAGLIGALCFLGPSCGSGNENSPDTNGKPDGAVSSAGGTAGSAAGGTSTLAGGGTTSLGGTIGSSSADHPLYVPDGGPSPAKKDAALPDAALPRDAPVSPDAARLPDAQPSEDSGKTSADADVVLYGLTPGTNCFKITSIAPGYTDGCQLGVETLPGYALQGDYDVSTGTFTLGAGGSLGSGPIRYNVGTLQRPQRPVSDPALPQCTWYQADTTTLIMTDTNKFTVSVVETQDSIAPVCGAIFATCTSTWIWTMEIDATKRGPTCD